MKRKDFLKSIGLAGAAFPVAVFAKTGRTGRPGHRRIQTVCTLVPTETFGPFPSLPSGDAMYWRSNIIDGQAGVTLNLTMQINGANTPCGPLVGARVDLWGCNASGFYSHYATGGSNNGHNGTNTPANNANLIYNRGTQVTNSAGIATFTALFPGWYPGRTCHFHFAVYTGGVVGSPSGWTLVSGGVSQFTFPIAEKNALYTSNAPYNTWGADPLLPDNDGVFGSPSGSWEDLQLATLSGSTGGPYTSAYEAAVNISGTLPLEFIGFNGSAMGHHAVLWWKTASEENFSHFEVEYSEDAEDFITVGRVAAKGNGLDQTNDYSFEDIDRLLVGNAYYRLKMVDMDGQAHYSAIVAIKPESEIVLRAYPIPAQDHLILQHPLSDGTEKVLVLSQAGRLIGIGEIAEGDDFTHIDLSLCDDGAYFLVYEKAQRAQTIKFVKRASR